MSLSVGDKVSLKIPMSYLKTNDIRPILRPPDLVSLDEIGQVIAIRAKSEVEVSFRRGTFLIPIEKLQISSRSIRN